MAGYDLDFNIPIRYREFARQWINYFQRLARSLGLEVRYRTRATQQGQAKIYAAVDGSLPAMQHLHRRLVNEAIRYAIVSGKPETLRKHILPPFMAAQTRGIEGITDLVFDVANDLEGEPARLSVSTGLLRRTSGRRTRLNRAIQTFIQAMDKWIMGDLSSEDTIILCDQGIEVWLKAQLQLQSSSRDSFPNVVDKAVNGGLLTRKEAYRLCRFHRTRNRVQHRGGRVRSETVLSMLTYCSRLVDQKTL